MNERWLFYKLTKLQQYLLSVLLVSVVSAVCYLAKDYTGYRLVALVLLFTVSVCAMFFDIYPVLLAALLSALFWDFFFIPPRFTFRISNTEDALLLLSYFCMALVNAVLTYRKQLWEKMARQGEERRAAVKLYNTLINSLSHELRTPISTILGAADNLKEQALSEKDKTDLLNQIANAALRLNGNVENLLNMSRLESGVIQPVMQLCDMHELARALKAGLANNLQTHALTITVQDGLPLFWADAGLLTQALHNLVNNALVHTPPQTQVQVMASWLPTQQLQLVVEDNGGGFAEEEQQRVFEKFYRKPGAKPGGVGLGLSIAKGFVEAHKGTIHLSSKPGQGARFTIVLPVKTGDNNKLRND